MNHRSSNEENSLRIKATTSSLRFKPAQLTLPQLVTAHRWCRLAVSNNMRGSGKIHILVNRQACFDEMLPWMVCCSIVKCSKQDASSRRRSVTQLQVLSGPKRLFICFHITIGTTIRVAKKKHCPPASCPHKHFIVVEEPC